MTMLYSDRASQIRTVTLTGQTVSLEEFVAVCRYDAAVHFSPAYEEGVQKGADRLKAILDSGKAVYGVNTGFGDNVRFRVADDELRQLQENIVRSHGCAMGTAMPRELVRAAMLALLIKIGYGCSGVRLDYMYLIRDYLNLGLCPYVPCQGAIGGLSSSPYLTMTLFGEGRFLDGERVIEAPEMLARHKLTPIPLGPKEGFALISDQATFLGPALLALYDLIDAYRHSLLCAGLVVEALQCTDKAFDDRLLRVKKHPEAVAVAAWLRNAVAGSAVMERAREAKVQDASGIRIIPHLFGVVGRQISEAHQVMLEELQSVCDNPVFLDGGVALMGSSWDSTYLALYNDTLAISVAALGKELETWIERLVDSKLSGLPHFLTSKPGLNNGFMIVQYAAAGLCGDLVHQANPASTFPATLSAGQEAPNFKPDATALKLRDSVGNLRRLTALALMTALQAVDFLDLPLSPLHQELRDYARRTVTFMEQDDRMYQRIEAAEALMNSGDLLSIAQRRIGAFPL